MQDRSMIPLHIRCTERNKIDPDYPHDDAKWWKLQEMKAKRETFGSETIYSRVPDIVAEFYINQSEDAAQVNGAQLAPILGMTRRQFNNAIRNYKRWGTLRQRPPSFYSGQMTEAEAKRDPYLQTLT